MTIPHDRLAVVFDRAIAECRARSAGYVALPAGESFTVEQVSDKPWSGYNWYQGGYRSVIQVNVSLPIWIDRAIDLACHEGYPGHHLYNALLEQELVRGRGWPEVEVYPLFSPQSLIAEGTANYGVELAFPAEERLAFERDVLFPMAGLDPALAAPYARVRELMDELSYAGNEAARRYLDGAIDAPTWLAISGDIRVMGGSLRTPAKHLAAFPMQVELDLAATNGRFSIQATVGGRPAQHGDKAWTRAWARDRCSRPQASRSSPRWFSRSESEQRCRFSRISIRSFSSVCTFRTRQAW